MKPIYINGFGCFLVLMFHTQSHNGHMKKLKNLLETVSTYDSHMWIYAKKAELDAEAMICSPLTALVDWIPIASLEHVLDSRSSWHERIDVDEFGIDPVWLNDFLEEVTND